MLKPFAVIAGVFVAGSALAQTPGVSTDYIAPGNPSTVGRSGSVVGPHGETIPAPRGAMSTLGQHVPGEEPRQPGADKLK